MQDDRPARSAGPWRGDGLDGFQRIKVDLTALDDASQGRMHDLAWVGPPPMIFFEPNVAEASEARIVGDVTTDTLQASIERTRR